MTLTMPTLKVEMAFGANFTTPLASMTWTDVSDYVKLERGMKIAVGRQDEFNNCDPNDISLVLRNDDGRFTPGLATSPYYPNVVLYVPIRVTALGGTGGLTSDTPIFYGYVDDWPVTWPGDIDLVSEVPITAHSRMARIGVEAELQTDLVAAHANALGYWPLTEGAGATAALPAVGTTAVPMTFLSNNGGTYAFGEDSLLTFDPGTALLLQNGGASGWTTLKGGCTLPDTSGFALSTWINTTISTWPLTAYALGLHLVQTIDNTTMTTTLTQSASGTTIVSTSTPVSGMTNAATHHLAAAVKISGSGTNWTYTVQQYLDGALVSQNTASGVTTAPDSGKMNITFYVQDNNISNAPYQMTFGHASVWPGSALASPPFSALYQAGLGYPNETTAARFSRLAQRAGVPAAEVSASGATACAAGYQTGAALDALRLMETTEGGVIWDRPDSGALELQSRNKRYQATSAFALDMSKGHVDNFDPVMDGTMLLNDVTVTTADNTVSVESQDTTSQTRYGMASTQITTYASDANDPAARGQWLVNGYKDPKVRVPSMSADLTLLPQDGVTLASILGTGVGSLFTVNNLPAQMGGGSASYFVEGWTDDIGVNEWTRTWNVAPSLPWLGVLVLDDSTRGTTDTINTLAY